MKRLCQNVQSTRKKKEEEEQDMNPKLEEMEEQKAAHVFCFAAIADANTGTLYINNTGKFPVWSLEGYLYLFVLYDYGTNAILVEPLWTMGSKEFIQAFQSKITYLTNQGFKPRFNVMDNIVSTAIREFLENEGIKLEIVEPNNHRINTAERAIQTFKDHFIAGLCTVDSKFPI